MSFPLYDLKLPPLVYKLRLQFSLQINQGKTNGVNVVLNDLLVFHFIHAHVLHHNFLLKDQHLWPLIGLLWWFLFHEFLEHHGLL